MKLTSVELAILIDAVDAWQNRDAIEASASGLFMGIMVAIGEPSSRRQDPESISKEIMQRGRAESEEKLETAILLKAKLVQMKREAESMEFNTL